MATKTLCDDCGKECLKLPTFAVGQGLTVTYYYLRPDWECGVGGPDFCAKCLSKRLIDYEAGEPAQPLRYRDGV